MTSKKVRLSILSWQTVEDVMQMMEDGDFPDEGEEPEEIGSDDPIELMTEGILQIGDTRAELQYREHPDGFGECDTVIGFDLSEPQLISVMRTGILQTDITFQPGKRHLCSYHTPIMDLELCTFARKVDNRLLTDGKMELDYDLEFHGVQAEHCYMKIEILP